MVGLLLTRWLTSLAVVALLCLALGGCRAGRDPPLSFCHVWVGKVPPGLAGALQLGWSLRDCPPVLSLRARAELPSLRSGQQAARSQLLKFASLTPRKPPLLGTPKSAPQPARACLCGRVRSMILRRPAAESICHPICASDHRLGFLTRMPPPRARQIAGRAVGGRNSALLNGHVISALTLAGAADSRGAG